jgi:hypothetical protein
MECKEVHLKNPVVAVHNIVGTSLNRFLSEIGKTDRLKPTWKAYYRNLMESNRSISLTPLVGDDMHIKAVLLSQAFGQIKNKTFRSSDQTVLWNYNSNFYDRIKVHLEIANPFYANFPTQTRTDRLRSVFFSTLPEFFSSVLRHRKQTHGTGPGYL